MWIHHSREITSTGNKLFVKFKSDGSVNLKGFRATWNEVTASSVSSNPASSGDVTSPNYPNNYPSVSDTSTTITVAAGSGIELTFVDINIEYESDCFFDYVQGKS